MGLIDKNRILEKLGQFHPDYMFNIASIKNFIKEEPEVEKKGKWIDTGDEEEWYAREYRCSECGDTMLGVANFCPNCGAEMQKGEEKEINGAIH